MDAFKDLTCRQGYAARFDTLVDFMCGMLRDKEILVGGSRKTIPMLSFAALRVVLVNPLIFQEFGASGARPLLEPAIGRRGYGICTVAQAV